MSLVHTTHMIGGILLYTALLVALFQFFQMFFEAWPTWGLESYSWSYATALVSCCMVPSVGLTLAIFELGETLEPLLREIHDSWLAGRLGWLVCQCLVLAVEYGGSATGALWSRQVPLICSSLICAFLCVLGYFGHVDHVVRLYTHIQSIIVHGIGEVMLTSGLSGLHSAVMLLVPLIYIELLLAVRGRLVLLGATSMWKHITRAATQ